MYWVCFSTRTNEGTVHRVLSLIAATLHNALADWCYGFSKSKSKSQGKNTRHRRQDKPGEKETKECESDNIMPDSHCFSYITHTTRRVMHWNGVILTGQDLFLTLKLLHTHTARGWECEILDSRDTIQFKSIHCELWKVGMADF